MESGQVEIGVRVRERMPTGMTQRGLAEQIDMPADALSRALNGSRGFASTELARIADVLGADLHWLITGREDPQRVRVAARHLFDHDSGQRSVPGREDDEAVLGNVTLAYRQAYPSADRPSAALPSTVGAVRSALGDGFARYFAEGIEEKLDVDVVRVPGLSTDYSFAIGGRRVILLAAQANWFRSNWSLAHELAHLVFGHHDVENAEASQEPVANRFAADLLLPEEILTSVDWEHITPSRLAGFIWDAGVSCDALIRRLDSLRIPVASKVRGLLDGPTQRLLRYHLESGESVVRHGPFVVAADPITARMNAAAARRFPLALLDAHVGRIAAGELVPGTLAWMLDTNEEDLVVDRPQPERMPVEDLAAALGL